jgi:hypothetical protein
MDASPLSLTHRSVINSEFFNLSMLTEGAGLAYLVGIQCLHTGRPELDPRQRQSIFPIACVSRQAPRPTQPPNQCVPGVPLGGGGGKRVRGSDHSTTCSAEVNNEEQYLLSPLSLSW